MKKILILMGRYLPGHRDGGPLRTIVNLTEALGDEYDFYIACLDRDHGDEKPYPDIARGCWNRVGKAKVWYVQPGGFTDGLILQLSKDKDLIYLCSFYDDYGYRTLMLRKQGKISSPVVLASMGVFSREALAQKALKKRLFIMGCKLAGLFSGLTWSVSTEAEAQDVRRVIGPKVKTVIAEDMPRSVIPEISRQVHDPLRIAFLSRICAHKGLDIAIDALTLVKHDFVFTVYGPVQEPDYWRMCREKLDRSGICWQYGGDVPSEKVQEVLSQEDVFLLPTKSENYGHVIFEALSVGCIPVISDTTPWSDALQTAQAGYTVGRNPQEFAMALSKIAALQPDQRRAMAENGVAFAGRKVTETIRNTGYRMLFDRTEKV